MRCATVILSILLAAHLNGQQVHTLALDTTGRLVVSDILLEGNETTVARIILRELTFSVGDTVTWSGLQAQLDQSENNLMNLGLFNFVEAQAIPAGEGSVIVLLSVQERWYIYPVPILEIAQTNFTTWWQSKEFRWLNYGLSVSHKNFRGRNEKLAFTARFGYTKKFSASYNVPNLNQKQTLGLYLSAGYFENEQIAINTIDNERVFYTNPENKARRYYQYKAGLSYRENIFLRHYLELTYFNAQVRDSVALLQPDYFAGQGTASQFLRLTYVINYDTRDYQRYPLTGMYVGAAFSQDGLGIVNRANLSLFTTQATFRHHMKVADRWYTAYNLAGKVNWEKPPYYLLQGLGYSDFVRGYELYIIDGTRWALFQSNLKYEILKPKQIELPFIPSDKFSRTFVALYANLFADAGYVYGEDFAANNSLVNEYLYSVGIGLDLVTYYDKVMRVEGSINGLQQLNFRVEFKQAF